MEKLVTIPGNVITALSKTHPLYQNDKAILSEEAADLIASTVEFRLKQILDVAKRLLNNSMRQINSNVLTPQDIRNSLISLNMPELDGYSNSFDYRYVWATKLFKGDRVIKRESSYRTSVGDKSWGRYRLSQLVKQDLQKPVPSPSGVTVSWSVVGGIVPLMATGMVEDVTSSFLKTTTNLQIKEKIKEVSFLDYAETEEKLDKITALAKEIKPLESDLTRQLGSDYLDQALLDAINKQLINDRSLSKTQKFVIPKIDYILTKEHRFFLKEIKNMLKRASFSQEPDIQIQYKKVVEILRNSLGLDQLLPELCHLFINEINRLKTDHSSFNIHVLLQYVEALTTNQNIQIHHYVHQLLIPLLQVLLSSEMDTNPIQIYKSLLLRKLSSQCISNISSSLKKNNNGLESIDDYLMNLYKNELTNENCSLPVLYGALCGISKLPLIAKRIVFYPLVPLLLAVVLKKQSKLKVFWQNRQKQRLKNFKQILLHEILHLLLEIIYDCSFEDILSTLEETGQLLTTSYEANTMVNEILMGSVNSSVNPELILQVYAAMLNKCYTLLDSLNTNQQIKRKYFQISDTNDSEEQNNCDETLPEVKNIKSYFKLHRRANPGMEDEPDSEDTPDVSGPNVKFFDSSRVWYNLNSIHSLTLTI
uniref:TATA box binding protein associated factor (TAF) histone-like fold domain-containing protein n=1 Tax=Theileria annulata TaxID=5874 RepID=A0A3B0MVP0_THEAN